MYLTACEKWTAWFARCSPRNLDYPFICCSMRHLCSKLGSRNWIDAAPDVWKFHQTMRCQVTVDQLKQNYQRQGKQSRFSNLRCRRKAFWGFSRFISFLWHQTSQGFTFGDSAFCFQLWLGNRSPFWRQCPGRPQILSCKLEQWQVNLGFSSCHTQGPHLRWASKTVMFSVPSDLCRV